VLYGNSHPPSSTPINFLFTHISFVFLKAKCKTDRERERWRVKVFGRLELMNMHIMIILNTGRRRDRFNYQKRGFIQQIFNGIKKNKWRMTSIESRV
jgi:hypothetical protein